MLERLGLLELDDRLDFSDLTDLGQLWACVRAAVEDNPILLTLAARWQELDATERGALLPTEQLGKELVDAAHYCATLHALTELLVHDERFDGEPPLLKQAVERLVATREAAPWRRYANLFERLKMMSLDQAIEVIARFKRDPAAHTEIHEVRGLFLQINVMEAMFQDALQRCEDNAHAGYPLFLHPSGRPAIEGLDNGLVRLTAVGGATHLPDRRPPFPRQWTQLYESWNLCFCSTYPNALDFYCKLLAPCVTGKIRSRPGLYIHYRGVALFLHAQHEMLQRVARGRAEPPVDQRNPILTRLWGEVNAQAAADYGQQVRIAIAQNNGPWVRIVQRLRAALHRPVWWVVLSLARLMRLTRR